MPVYPGAAYVCTNTINGWASNGWASNGLIPNALTDNALTQNGFKWNALTANGLGVTNGLNQSGSSVQTPAAYQPQPIAVFSVRLPDGSVLTAAPTAGE
jgi:hypothetical protein